MSRGVGLDVVDIVDDGVEYADRVGVFVVCVGVVYCGFGVVCVVVIVVIS